MARPQSDGPEGLNGNLLAANNLNRARALRARSDSRLHNDRRNQRAQSSNFIVGFQVFFDLRRDGVVLLEQGLHLGNLDAEIFAIVCEDVGDLLNAAILVDLDDDVLGHERHNLGWNSLSQWSLPLLQDLCTEGTVCDTTDDSEGLCLIDRAFPVLPEYRHRLGFPTPRLAVWPSHIFFKPLGECGFSPHSLPEVTAAGGLLNSGFCRLQQRTRSIYRAFVLALCTGRLLDLRHQAIAVSVPGTVPGVGRMGFTGCSFEVAARPVVVGELVTGTRASPFLPFVLRPPEPDLREAIKRRTPAPIMSGRALLLVIRIPKGHCAATQRPADSLLSGHLSDVGMTGTRVRIYQLP